MLGRVLCFLFNTKSKSGDEHDGRRQASTAHTAAQNCQAHVNTMASQISKSRKKSLAEKKNKITKCTYQLFHFAGNLAISAA